MRQRRRRLPPVLRLLPASSPATCLASSLMPLRKPGRVTRSCIVCGSWQSMHDTGCADQLPGLLQRHGADRLEALHHVAAARLAVGRDDRGVAVQAGARLLELLDALGVVLVLEHEGVAAALAVVHAERIAGEDALAAGGPRPAWTSPRCRRAAARCSRRALVAVVLRAGSSCPTRPGRWCPRSARRA